MGTSAVAEISTSNVGAGGSTGKAVGPLVKSGREIFSSWVRFFIDDATSVEARWKEDGARFKVKDFLEDAHFRVMGERRDGRIPWCL